MKVCVIGAGVVGCSVGLELRRRGCDVQVVDRNGDVGHGSTSASCAIVRRFYSQPGMIAMAHEALQIWRSWSSYLGPIEDDLAILHQPGMLFIPPHVDDGVRNIVEHMKKLGIAVTLLSSQDVAARFPFLNPASLFPPRPLDDPQFFSTESSNLDGAVFEEDAGYVVSPGLATQNLRLAGEREGVQFLLKHEVEHVHRQEAGGFRVGFVGGKRLECDVVVNVAGPHSSRVNALSGVALPLETRALRREVHNVPNPEFRDGKGSSLPIVGDINNGIYFRPEAGGRELIVGTTDPECDEAEWVADADAYDTSVSSAYHQRQCLRLMKRFAAVRLPPARGIANLYDVTVRDWYPIADRTDLPGYYVCIGTSGSSFKTAPVLGRLMAEIIDASEGGRDIDREPVMLQLPHIGTTVDTSFLSRLRGDIESSGSVIG
jgi:sarcosine oxidase subunit beta